MKQVYQWETAALSHTGNVRMINEDALLDRTEDGLWLVADGMGGHDSGDVASQSIVHALASLVLPSRLSSVVESIEVALEQVNAALITEAKSREDNSIIGSTAVVLVSWGTLAIMMWVGDSRLYRLRDGVLSQLTQDHTQVEALVQQGLLSKEEAETHPQSNVITRAVGASEYLLVDIDHEEVELGDYFLLCSDGLNKELSDREIESVLKHPGSADQHCLELVNKCLERNGQDNVTLILAKATNGSL
jgi:serine/threonine protein phosphatase PrpC